MNSFYTGSRVLYGLALDHQAPPWFRKVTVGGRPLLALALLAAWCFSSYMGQNEENSGAPHTWSPSIAYAERLACLFS